MAPRRDEADLAEVLAKSASHSGLRREETLTEHSRSTLLAARRIAARIGHPGVLAGLPRFWDWITWAALLHDAGKVADGFQQQLKPGGQRWGERHEVLSLAYVDVLTAHLPDSERLMIATGVVFHHRCLTGWGQLAECYPADARWEAKFGRQVRGCRHEPLVRWLADTLGTVVNAEAPALRLWERARDLFMVLERHWNGRVSPDEGLIGVLLQGAVTLADHSASAHVELQTDTPLPLCFLDLVKDPYPHQREAGTTDGHLVLLSATGSGKTEAGLAWASRQMETLPGLPRLAWLLPYRASIDAARDRFTTRFGCPADGIGVLHATAAATLLGRIVDDDQAPGAAAARKARAMSGAMRLFRQRVRVATPYQMLRAALAGPKYSSVLLEQAGSMIVLDEMHAYDPVTFGRICAAMQLWEKLGSRVAVLSATLAPPMISLITSSLSRPVAVHRAAPGTAPIRHRLAIDAEPITSPASLERITSWLEEGRSVLAVANTVAGAQELYRALAWPDSELLHSRFRLIDRRGIEQRIRVRHPERRPGDPEYRGGGLTVATQALEVSLCLDHDRGVTDMASVEAIAQRAGRVNRRGLHPDGPVEFRVHAVASPRPYGGGAVDAAVTALRDWDGALISEEAIQEWLERAYATPWGRSWEAEARRNRDEFTSAFLTFTDPFGDRTEFAARLEESFDTVEVLLDQDRERYQELRAEDPLLAADLLIPIRWTDYRRVVASGRAAMDRQLEVPVVDARYDERTGLDLRTPASETIL